MSVEAVRLTDDDTPQAGTVPLRSEREYGISFVAEFFDMTVQWVRWCESAGYFKYGDGTSITPRRTKPRRAKAGYRKYTLQNISDMADSLYRLKKITTAEYRSVKAKVETFQ